jgi:hypothetical protein
MPMLDAYIPEGALALEAEDKLLARLTDLLLVEAHFQQPGAEPVLPGTSPSTVRLPPRPPQPKASRRLISG